MKSELGKEVMVKLLECILQSRIDVKKQQIRTFDKVTKQVNKQPQNAYQNSLDAFLQDLLLTELYDLRKEIQEPFSQCHATIAFKLVKKNKGHITLAQIWEISFQQFGQIEAATQKQEFKVVSTTFEELLLFLNRQPLFSEYQKNIHFKSNYSLHYEISFNHHQRCSQGDILTLSNKCTKERTSSSMSILIDSYFMPKFDQLYESSMSKFLPKSKKEKKGTDKNTLDCTDEIQIQEVEKKQQVSKKVNLYQFYDKELEFVFLASDDENFMKKEKLQLNTIEIEEEDSEEFEILMITKEEEFILDNKNLLLELATGQHSYFQI